MNEKILFQNKTWHIAKINEFELRISDEYICAYAYFDSEKNKLQVDRKIYPKYIEKKAISIAKKNIKCLYTS